MPLPLAAAAAPSLMPLVGGTAAGGIAGLFNKTQNGNAVGNRFGGDSEAAGAMGNLSSAQTALRALQDQPHMASSQVASDPILGQLYGPQGTLSRTNQEEQQLASRGYSLQPEDYEAYGQASGNIARMFGSQEQGLAQDLANRGLSSSGVAGQQFSNMYGNKQEQLGQLQTQIAQNRMKMNMERLGQTRNFLGQLGGQASNAIQNQYGRDSDAAQNNYNASQGILKNIQGQDNEMLSQQRQGATPTDAARFTGGLMGGAKVGTELMGTLSGSKTGIGG